MLNFQCATKKDLQERAAIERRRQNEQERRKRIFNPKTRLIGNDYEALERQVYELKARKDEEREINRKFEEEQKKQAEVLRLKEIEIEQARRSYEKDLIQYRNTYQRKEDQRDFDLSDPRGMKKGMPARIDDNDPRLSLSGAQIFVGEDLMYRERKRAQIAQQKAWLEQQIAERKMAENFKKKADMLNEEALINRDRRALELGAAESNGRKRIQEETALFNRKLAAEQENRRAEKQRQEQEDNLAEMLNNITGDMLTENPDTAKSSFGTNRIIPYMYRGMQEPELENLRLMQKEQLEENKKKREEERYTECQWETLANSVDRTAVLKDREIGRRTKAINTEILQENTKMAVEQHEKQDFIDNVLYTNTPDPTYYDQFNTSTR